jgi:hypothetical protein
VPWPPHGNKKAPRPSDTSGVFENTTGPFAGVMWAAYDAFERVPIPTGKVERGERKRTAAKVSKSD